MSATVLHPFVNGGIGVFCGSGIEVIFREKLILSHFFAIAAGLGAMVILNL